MLLLNHSCDIWRTVAVGTNGRSEMQELHTDVRCLVLPMGANATIQNDLQIGRAYEVSFAPDADIQVGDRIMWNGSRLSVKYVRDYRNTPPVSHFEAVCEQEVVK